MSGDYSRNGFDPLLDDLGVLLEQGRPLTDRDWNDLVQQVSRRIHAGTLDTIGPAAVPTQTPDAFKVTAVVGNLNIARGRMYVDGLLAENHGAPPANSPLSWDPHLAEQFGSDPLHYKATDYTAQPYYPNPPALPTTAGPHLVYLDVWQREVTHTMRPALIDRALGIDTTTRLQTVWQVKVLADVGSGVTCATPLETVPGWLPQNAPSAGRLSTTTALVPGQPDPCDVPPAGGYKGKENQLYRVEIHKGGAPGTATFKWSRDDASIETAITAIPTPTQLVGDRVVWDDLRRFSSGDWIEVTDDWLELHGDPGILVQIKTPNGVDDATRTITLAQALPPGTFPTGPQNLTDPLRHMRIRRWDQKDKVYGATGTAIADPNLAIGSITVPGDGTQRLLEQGIVVDFSVEPVGGLFRSGDFWVFAARAGDATIEELKDAPPRGIHHHYAKLGLWNGAPGDVPDCRTHWPPECGGCCTVTVAPGDDIQAAIDSLPPTGGCVCLKTGVHPISDALRIRGSNVALHGESAGAVVRHSAGPLMLQVASDDGSTIDHVCVESIRFEATHDGSTGELLGAALLDIRRLADGSLRGCTLAAATAVRQFAAVGVLVSDSSRVTIEENTFENLLAGVLVLRSGGIDIRRNLLLGPTLDGETGPVSTGLIGIEYDEETVGPASIEGNRLDNYRVGILLGTASEGARVTENQATRNGPTLVGSTPGTPFSLSAGTLVAAEATMDMALAPAVAVGTTRLFRIFAIDVGGEGTEVVKNIVNLTDARQGGIRLRGDRQRAAHNLVRSDVALQEGAVARRLLPLGIVIANPFADHPLADCCVEGNGLTGLQNAITLGDSPDPTHHTVIATARPRVLRNRIEGSADLVAELADPFINPEAAVTFTADTTSILTMYAILAAEVQDGVIADNQVAAFPSAILLSGCDGMRVTGNDVHDGVVGVLADTDSGVAVSHNALKNLPFAAIHATSLTDASIEANTISSANWFGIGMSNGINSRVADNRISEGGVGIWLNLEHAPTLVGNVVSHMQSSGLVCAGCLDGVTCAHNQIAWSSYGGFPLLLASPTASGAENLLAIGLLVYGSDGLVTIESCNVVGTGRSGPEDPATVFSQSTYQIASLSSGNCRLHNNTTIEANGLVGDEWHAALVVRAFGRKVDEWQSAELTDNNVNGMGSPLVLASGSGDLSFSNNRCAHTPVVGQRPGSTVQLTAQRRVGLVGNMIRAIDGTVPSLTITGPFVSAVGNITTGPWSVTGNVVPTPFAQFNQVGVS